MKNILVLMGGLLALAVGGVANADCAGGSTLERVQKAFALGQAYERNHQPAVAVNEYLKAQAYVCGQSNPVQTKAARKAAALALRLAQQEEARKHLFGGHDALGFYEGLMLQVVAAKAGAYEWYEAGGYFAEADRALLLALQQDPGNLDLYNDALTHFRDRALPSFVNNNRIRIEVTRPYTLDAQYRQVLQDIPATAVQRILQQEDKRFDREYLKEQVALAQALPKNPGDFVAAQRAEMRRQAASRRWPKDPLSESRDQLQAAQRWTNFIERSEDKARWSGKIRQRVLDRGNELLQKWYQSPGLLTAASEYFRSVNEQAKVDEVHRRAKALGEQAATTKQLLLAGDYFQAAGDEQRAEEISAEAEAAAENMTMPSMEQARALAEEMQKKYGNPEQIEAARRQAEAAAQRMQQERNGASGAGSADELQRQLGL